MSRRQLVVLGTASQVPTRDRAHNGYVLFFDEDAILFDPGEGTQRQMTFARISVSDLTRVAITHLHGDHALGLAGIAQRASLDEIQRPLPVAFPASGAEFVERLCDATVYHHRRELVRQPLPGPGPVPRVPGERASTAALTAVRLDHGIDTLGYRVVEPDGRALDPEKVAAVGIAGSDIGVLVREGSFRTGDRTVRVEDVSHRRQGQSVGFCMDTRLCDGVYEVAQGVDLLVIESTYLHRDRRHAVVNGHLTARQAATVAAECGVRHLVLSHFSQRYSDPAEFEREAREVYDGPLTVAADLDRIDLPARQ